jgi:DNA polymerase-3 subunit gamma/tau
MSYLVLARKWRPGGFEDLAGQESITRILRNAISQGKVAHAYLFSGPRGVGKTSSARILAKALNCADGPTPQPCGKCSSCTSIADGSSVDVIEIDGASNNSVDDIRDLRERVKYAPSGGRYKVYIIDEVHMLSGSAFNALLKTLEEPPSHVIFVLATTEMKKIPATVLSRCQHMPFRRISGQNIRTRLQQISASEGISIAPPALGLIAKAADGSMRDGLTILDQLSSFSSDVTEDDVKSLLGLADFSMLSRISMALIEGNRVDLLGTINLLSEQGTDMRSFTRELVRFFRDLLVAGVTREPENVLDLSPEEIAVIKKIISRSTEEQLTLMLSEMMKAATDVKNSASPRIALEMGLIRASFLSAMKPLKEVIERISHLGNQVSPPVDTKKNVSSPHKPDAPEIFPSKVMDAEIKGDNALSEFPPEEPLNYKQETVQPPKRSPDIEKAWETTLEKIGPPLASKLSQAGIQLNGSELSLVLDSGHAVFEDSIKSNLPEIERILSEEYRSELKLKVTISGRKKVGKKDLKEKILQEPLIKEALELFEGRIVDVKPLENSENIPNGGKDV